MEAQFWRDKWVSNQIGFHQEDVHPVLVKYWDVLGLDPGARVFVPLCGKSKDMIWLSQRGYDVVGIELSDVAVSSFCEENGLAAVRDECNGFVRFRADGYTIFCGDLFDSTPATIGPFAAVYDRASLIALPPAMREAYCAKLRILCGTGVEGLLITVDYPSDAISPPPFVVADAEIKALYEDWCDIEALGSAAALVKDVAGTETAWRLHVR